LPELTLETEAFIPTIAKTRQTARRNFVIILQAARLDPNEKIKMQGMYVEKVFANRFAQWMQLSKLLDNSSST
jgi:hypothetical protein